MNKYLKLAKMIYTMKYKCNIIEETIINETKLSPSGYRVIQNMDRNDELSIADLSSKMNLSVSRGSRIIESMVKSNYLKIRKDLQDNRISLLSLDKKGIDVKDKIEKFMEECGKKISRSINEEDIEKVLNSISSLVEAL